MRRLVVAAEPVTSVDVTAADVLAELAEAYMPTEPNCAPPSSRSGKDKLKRFELYDIGRERFFPTVETAVASYVEEYPAD